MEKNSALQYLVVKFKEKTANEWKKLNEKQKLNIYHINYGDIYINALTHNNELNSIIAYKCVAVYACIRNIILYRIELLNGLDLLII